MAADFTNTALSDALVILGAAGIVIPAFARLRITPIVGFILIGVAVGPFGLGAFVTQHPWLFYVTISDTGAIEPFAEFGIIMLLFSVGLELSFRRLWDLRRLVFGVGAAELIGCSVVIGGVLFLFGEVATAALGLGLALALSSTALVLPISGTRSPVGRAALSMLLFEDLAIVPIIFLLGALAPYAASGGWDGMTRTLWTGSLVVIGMLVAGRYMLPLLFGQAARAKNPEVFLAASLLVVIVASLATGATGLSPIVGALLAGLLIAETEYSGEVENVTAPLKGLALGIFLITVGMQVDLRAIAANWAGLAAAVVGVLLIKALVTGGLLRIVGARPGTAIETGVLMASPSETTLIVLAAAAQAQVIAADTAAFWQIVTAIGLTITPILARVGHDISRRIEMRSRGDALSQDIGSADPRTLVIGCGRVGRVVADLMATHNQPFLMVEADIDSVAAGRRDGYPVIFGDVARGGLLDRFQLDTARALILTMDDPVLMNRLIKQVSAAYPDLPIVARARDANHAGELYRAGASDAVPENLESSLQMSESLLVRLGVAMGPVIASIHDKRDEFRARIKSEGDLDYEPSLKARTMPTER